MFVNETWAVVMHYLSIIVTTLLVWIVSSWMIKVPLLIYCNKYVSHRNIEIISLVAGVLFILFFTKITSPYVY